MKAYIITAVNNGKLNYNSNLISDKKKAIKKMNEEIIYTYEGIIYLQEIDLVEGIMQCIDREHSKR